MSILFITLKLLMNKNYKHLISPNYLEIKKNLTSNMYISDEW